MIRARTESQEEPSFGKSTRAHLDIFFSPCVTFGASTVEDRSSKLLQCESLWRTWAVTTVWRGGGGGGGRVSEGGGCADRMLTRLQPRTAGVSHDLLVGFLDLRVDLPPAVVRGGCVTR